MNFETKKGLIANQCIYGKYHFCDGEVNKSIIGNENADPKPACPKRYTCPIRERSVFDDDE